MTLPNTPAEPVQPEKALSPQADTTPTSEQPPEQPQGEPKYVTAEQLASIKDEIIRDVNMRSKQRANAIKEQFTQLKKTLEASGVVVTPEQEEKIQTQVAASYRDDEEPEPEVNLEDVPPMVQVAIAMMQDAKVDVVEGDPEFTEFVKPILDTNPNGPALLRATAKAIEAKQARTLQNKDKAELRLPTKGSGAGPGEFVAKSAKDYQKQLAAERRNS